MGKFRDLLESVTSGISINSVDDLKTGYWAVPRDKEGNLVKTDSINIIGLPEDSIQGYEYRKSKISYRLKRMYVGGVLLTDDEFKKLKVGGFDALKFIKDEAKKLNIPFKKISFKKKIKTSQGYLRAKGGREKNRYGSEVTIVVGADYDGKWEVNTKLTKVIEDKLNIEMPYDFKSLNIKWIME